MGGTLRKWPNWDKEANFGSHFHVKMHCCWLRFMLVESFSPGNIWNFVWTTFYDIQPKENIKNIQKMNHSDCNEIGYFAQFGIFADISCSRQSQISFFIYYFLLATCRNKNNVVFQAHEYARVTLHYSEWQIFQVPSKRRNQIQVETLAKKWALIYWTLVKNQTQCFFWVQNRLNILLCVLYLTFLL